MTFCRPIRLFANSFSAEMTALRTLAFVLLAALVFASALSTASMAGERYAVVIANQKYRHTEDVAFAVRDANAVARALTDTMGIRPQNIRTIRNASLADLSRLFGSPGRPGQLGSLVKDREGELFVYFAGHGSREAKHNSQESEGYILGTDSYPDDLANSAYGLTQMRRQLYDLRNTFFPAGRVTLVLETCFSGRSHAGELVTNRSAPLHGRPVILSDNQVADGQFVELAAAEGNQYAVWDTEYQQSMFTDALVSALYGEADDTQFGGDGDGQVTLSEVERFVKDRMSRRLEALVPGTAQRPSFVGGSGEEVLVERDRIKSIWGEITRRRRVEELQILRLVSTRDVESAERFRRTCLYCGADQRLTDFIRQEHRQRAICEADREYAKQLIEYGTRDTIRAFVPQCQNMAELLQPLRTRLHLLTKVARLDALTDAHEAGINRNQFGGSFGSGGFSFGTIAQPAPQPEKLDLAPVRDDVIDEPQESRPAVDEKPVAIVADDAAAEPTVSSNVPATSFRPVIVAKPQVIENRTPVQAAEIAPAASSVVANARRSSVEVIAGVGRASALKAEDIPGVVHPVVDLPKRTALEDETETSPVATSGEVVQTQDEFEVATLQPVPDSGLPEESQKGGESIASAPDVADLTHAELVAFQRDMQGQLKRLGCYAGNVDGSWDATSDDAFERAATKVADLAAEEGPTLASLDILRAIQELVCIPGTDDAASGEKSKSRPTVRKKVAPKRRTTTTGKKSTTTTKKAKRTPSKGKTVTKKRTTKKKTTKRKSSTRRATTKSRRKSTSKSTTRKRKRSRLPAGGGISIGGF